MQSLVRRQPFSFAALPAHIDELFDRLGEGGRGFVPAIDVIRDADSIRVEVDVPGMKPDEVRIKAENGVLTISGEHEESSEHKADDERYIRRERSYGSFVRSLALPEGVDPEAIEAKTHDGVLEISIPLPSSQQKRVVEITPSSD